MLDIWQQQRHVQYHNNSFAKCGVTYKRKNVNTNIKSSPLFPKKTHIKVEFPLFVKSRSNFPPWSGNPKDTLPSPGHQHKKLSHASASVRSRNNKTAPDRPMCCVSKKNRLAFHCLRIAHITIKLNLRRMNEIVCNCFFSKIYFSLLFVYSRS